MALLMNMVSASRAALLLLCLCGLGNTPALAALCGRPNAAGAMLCSVDPAIDPRALCNDGTVPVFWVRPGSGTGLHRWVIWLQGGGECIDTPSCSKRATGGTAQFITSRGFGTASGGGVLSASPLINPLLNNANTVLLHYCSSDDWSGAAAATGSFDAANPATWHFQGRRIAMASLSTLNGLGLGLGAATQILLGGSSAGGVGIVSDANDLLPLLPRTADIRLANDAGFVIDIGQYDLSLPAPYVSPAQPNTFDLFFAAGIGLWHGRGDAKCDAAALTRLQHIDCYDTANVMQKGLIALPSFVAESRLDVAQLDHQLCSGEAGGCVLPHDPGAPAGIYATAFSLHMAKSLKGAGAGARYAVYAPDAYLHVILSDDAAFNAANSFGSGSLAARDVFDSWLIRPAARRIVHVGTAPGVAGGSLPP